MKHRGGVLNDLVEGMLGWLGDHGLGKQWEKRNKAAGCFSKENGRRPCHPLGYGFMRGKLLASTSQVFQTASHLILKDL